MKGPYTGMRVRITEPTGGGKTRERACRRRCLVSGVRPPAEASTVGAKTLRTPRRWPERIEA